MVFPRLDVTTRQPLPAGSLLPVGAKFARVDPPNSTSLNDIFRTWRLVTWEVVPHTYQRWNIDKHKYEQVKTTAVQVSSERELTADEITYWQGE